MVFDRCGPLFRLVTMTALVVLSGCQSDEPAGGAASTPSPRADGGSWAAEFARARAEATSDFERQVLADGVITEAEFMEALDRRGRCYADHGHPGELQYLGYGLYGFKYATDGLDEAGAATLEEMCVKGTILVIEPLYNGIMSNPDNEDYAGLVAGCLAHEGLAPEGYSAEAYLADIDAGTQPYSSEDPRVWRCEQDPKGRFAGETLPAVPSS